MAPNDGIVTIENARIIFRNFAGREGMYNAEGTRTFHVLLEEELAKQLEEDGWSVKYLRAREEGDEPQPHMQVMVKYRARDGRQVRPPRIVMRTSRNRTPLGEEEVEVLDWVDMETVDLVLRPYEWNIRGETGIKAYLKTMFVTIREDPIEMKYAELDELEDLPTRSGRIDEGEPLEDSSQ